MRRLPIPSAVLLAPYLLLCATSFLMFGETTDDPFITCRYAANLLAGHGPVFNPGEHVEGFSSPLHLLLCVAALKFLPWAGILIKLKAASLLFGLVYLYQTGILARIAGLGRADQVLAQCLVALNVNFAIAAVNALETTLFGAVLLWALIVFIRESARGNGWLSALVLFLAVLCRPEALAVFALLAAARGWQALTFRFSRRDAVTWVAAFCLPALGMTCARYWYYHALLPNTYYAKNGPLWISIRLGTESLLQSLSPERLDLSDFHAGQMTLTQALQLAIAPIFWGLAALGLWSLGDSRERRAVRLTVAASIVAFCIASWRSGGDWMYGCRFLSPALAMFAVLQCLGLRTVAEWRARVTSAWSERPVRSAPRFGPARAAALAIWAFALIASPRVTWATANFSTRDEDLLVHGISGFGPLWVRVARYMKSDVPAGAVIVYSEMGYGPYNNLDKKFIDIRGLTDYEIARLPSSLKRYIGVYDRHWDQDNNDELDQILMHRKFNVIIDAFPTREAAPVLFGRYARRNLDVAACGTIEESRVAIYRPTVKSAEEH